MGLLRGFFGSGYCFFGIGSWDGGKVAEQMDEGEMRILDHECKEKRGLRAGSAIPFNGIWKRGDGGLVR